MLPNEFCFTPTAAAREVDRRFGTCEHKSRGYAVSVVVLRKIAGSSDKSDDSKELIEVFADVLHKRLKRGQCEDDVLIVFSSEDNLLHTVVGSVARRKIHSEIVNQVEQFAKANHINNGDHTSGLLFMINVYGRVLAGENYLEALPPINEAGYTNGLKKILPKWPRWLVFLLIIGIPIFVIVAVIVCAFLFGFRRYIQRHGYTPGRQTT
ncbi:hypothetical protein M3Y94_00598300 [Aphelenchoides besseyi]|nr:hypothetical protein M3Y94_00598300 [Aphelenchoides besseyi]